MDLQITNYNKSITEWCNTILASHYNLSFLAKEYSEEKVRKNRAVIDRNLIRMTLSAQHIVDLVYPIPDAGEIHGLPKEATMADDEPDVIIVDKEHRNWDFKAWFAEKSGVLIKAIRRLMDYLEMDYETMASSHMSVEEWDKFVAGMVRSNMRQIEAKAKAILEMIESDRLVIKDVRVDEEED